MHMYIIGGPTASGKSLFALNLAQQVNGEVINGDSMQLYSHLSILTARPRGEQGIPHHLYGVLHGNETSSVGWWYPTVCQLIENILSRGKTPIVVGGTGLYLRALTHGLSPIPPIPDAIRQEARHLAETLSPESFYEMVIHEDPKVREALHKNDTQRLTRALEVVRTMQKSIQDCQGRPQKIIDVPYRYLVLLPSRDVLYQSINDRFRWMIERGALEEVEALFRLGITPTSPILKAVGVKELRAYLQSSLSLEEAIRHGQQSSRQYAKRQMTWFSRQVPEAEVIKDIPSTA